MNKNNRKYFSVLACIVLLACLIGHVFVLPLVLMKKLNDEASVYTSSMDLKNNNPDRLKIEIPMALPYASEWDDAKESEGLIERNGEFYTLVSRNFKNDTLYFEYIKNSNAREIFSLLSDNVEAQNEKDPKSNDFGQIFCKWLTLKYQAAKQPIVSLPTDIDLTAQQSVYTYLKNYHNIDLEGLTPPPRQI